LGKRIENLYGQGYIEDTIGGIVYQISPLSFYQVNPLQTKKLYDTVLEYAALQGEEIVWDLYCGIGTISLFLAQKAAKVCGVEIIPQAVEDARRNAQRNHMNQVEFFVGAAEEVVPEQYAKSNGSLRADVVTLDPPRKGCEERLLQTVIEMQPQRIVYVSCDPATLARDLRYLCDRGYALKRVRACDMFGQSFHVETVCLLSRKDNRRKLEQKCSN
jgi:23S rRNA (uracil1939-C5)-methyltransferase